MRMRALRIKICGINKVPSPSSASELHASERKILIRGFLCVPRHVGRRRDGAHDVQRESEEEPKLMKCKRAQEVAGLRKAVGR